VTRTSFGLFLNCGGEAPGRSHDAVFELALAEADLAERLGYRDLWVTEHHFIPFGVNPSALAMASYLLGRTRWLRVGTAVTLAPLYHPLQLAEQAALLDQLSGGRFDFGIGRGGYLRDFVEFGIDLTRWDREESTLDALADAWASTSELTPRPRTARIRRSTWRARLRPRWSEPRNSAHRCSTHVPQVGNRHVGPDGRPLDRAVLADFAARSALVGSPAQLPEALRRLRDEHGIRRFVLYMKPIGERQELLESIERFAKEVVPGLEEDA
jgi:alkanesulfonate monooxygenase SsuD/methylene tetrahydromethanopterin reductase-like flavin-dependent oxidoreductase (luciferase family)